MRSNDDNIYTFTGRSEGRPRGGGNNSNDGGGGGGGEGRSGETPGATGDGAGHTRATSSSATRKRAREGVTGEATATATATAAAEAEAATIASASSPPAARGGRTPGGGFAIGGDVQGAPASLRASNAGVSAAAPLGYDHGPTADGAEGPALASFAASLLAAGRERDMAWARDRELALRAALLGRSAGHFPPSMSSASTSSSLSAAAALDVPTQLLLLSQLPNSGSGAYSLGGAFGQAPQPQQPRDALQEYVEAQAHLLLLARHNSLLPPSLPSQREWGLAELLRAQQAAALQRDTAAVEAALSSSFTTPASAAASGPYPWDLPARRLEARRSSPGPRMFTTSEEEQKDAMTGRPALWPSAGSPFRRLADPSLSPPPARLPPPPSAAPQVEAASAATATSKPNVPPPPIPISQPQPPMVPCRFHPRAINVSLPTDGESTSKFQALLRDQLLYVEAVPLDVQASTQGRNRPIRAGQVGILCRHCRNIPPRNRPRGAIYFPHKLLSIYQSAQNMANHHYHPESGCPNAPDDINASLRLARADKSIVYGGGQQYWARAASQSGLVETEGGLAFSFAAPTTTAASATTSTSAMTASSPAAA